MGQSTPRHIARVGCIDLSRRRRGGLHRVAGGALPFGEGETPGVVANRGAGLQRAGRYVAVPFHRFRPWRLVPVLRQLTACRHVTDSGPYTFRTLSFSCTNELSLSVGSAYRGAMQRKGYLTLVGQRRGFAPLIDRAATHTLAAMSEKRAMNSPEKIPTAAHMPWTSESRRLFTSLRRCSTSDLCAMSDHLPASRCSINASATGSPNRPRSSVCNS